MLTRLGKIRPFPLQVLLSISTLEKIPRKFGNFLDLRYLTANMMIHKFTQYYYAALLRFEKLRRSYGKIKKNSSKISFNLGKNRAATLVLRIEKSYNPKNQK